MRGTHAKRRDDDPCPERRRGTCESVAHFAQRISIPRPCGRTIRGNTSLSSCNYARDVAGGILLYHIPAWNSDMFNCSGVDDETIARAFIANNFFNSPIPLRLLPLGAQPDRQAGRTFPR